jgi:hypothetical protein
MPIAIWCAAVAFTPESKAQDVEPATLPRDWTGVWEGDCSLTPPFEGVADFKARLDIEPFSGRRGYAWTLDYLYADPARKESRIYSLVPVPDSARGHFILDEQNGLLIDSFFDKSVLRSAYVINGRLYEFSYRLSGDLMIIESPYYREAPVRESCLSGAASLCAKSLQLLGVQACTLARQQPR